MRRPRRDEEGFALVFVLLVTAVVTVAVASVLTVVTPDISRTKLDQDAQGASAAARAAIDDFVAYLSGIDKCRSTTRVCSQARGAASAVKTLDPATGSTMSWTSDTALTAAGDVRVHGTGTYGRATRTLDADIRLAPSILSYGYYSDYESQGSDLLQRANPGRTVRIDNSTSWSAARLSSATTVTWVAPTNTTTCERHWWDDRSVSPTVAGRGTQSAVWTATARFDTTSSSRSVNGGCDIIFATGMTFDGPVYTRDALLIDGTGGTGPVFQQPVLTGWGYGSRTSPAASRVGGQPAWWRLNTTSATLAGSPYAPEPARFDLTLPPDLGTEGLSDNACVYTGPTRVRLLGDGSALITSPRTTTRASGADPACYPAALGAAGVNRWRIDYRTVGGGTVVARNIGTAPFAVTGQKVTTTPSAATSTFWTTDTAGAPSNGTSTAPDTGCSGTAYAATVGATCAWTETPTFDRTSGGWTSYTSGGSCGSTYAATNQRLFECEYSAKVGGNQTYASFRSAVTSALSTSTCATPGSSATTRQQCLVDLLTARLPTSTTARRYVVTPTTGTAVAGSTRALSGATPAFPQADDPIFAAGPTGAGSETSSSTPVTLAVARQTSTNGGQTWSTAVSQFSLTVTSTTWSLASAASATSYFPSVQDVTQYGSSSGTAVAGDLYVEGTNRGKLSLLADRDAVVTGDLRNASSDVNADAVNVVAGSYVRNYHPVRCVSSNTDSISRTSAGFCPNDITSLYSGDYVDGNVFNATHPASQYANLQPTGDRTVDAALFALNGSFTSDNYQRAPYVGQIQINGGVYQQHRGVNGTQSKDANSSGIARSGYLLQYHYVDLRNSTLPYEPTVRVKSGRVWSIVSVGGGGPS